MAVSRGVPLLWQNIAHTMGANWFSQQPVGWNLPTSWLTHSHSNCFLVGKQVKYMHHTVALSAKSLGMPLTASAFSFWVDIHGTVLSIDFIVRVTPHSYLFTLHIMQPLQAMVHAVLHAVVRAGAVRRLRGGKFFLLPFINPAITIRSSWTCPGSLSGTNTKRQRAKS